MIRLEILLLFASISEDIHPTQAVAIFGGVSVPGCSQGTAEWPSRQLHSGEHLLGDLTERS